MLQIGSRAGKASCFRRLVAELLEARTLLFSPWTITIDDSGPLLKLTFEEAPSSTGSDIVTLSLDTSGNLSCEFTGAWETAINSVSSTRGLAGPVPPGPFPIDDVGSITVRTSGGSDRLVLDFVNGGPVPVEGIDYRARDAPGDTDVLELISYDLASLVVTPTGDKSGSVRLEQSREIAFRQIDEVVLGGSVVDLVTDLSQIGGPAVDAVLANYPVSGFSALGGGSLSSTQFTNPNGSLSVSAAGAGKDHAATIHVEGLDAAYDADLTIEGGNTGTVRFRENALDLGASERNLTVAAQTIRVEQRLSASGNVDFAASLDFTSSGNARISADGSLAITVGNDALIDAALHSNGADVSLTAGGDVRQNADITVRDANTISVSSGGDTVMSPRANTIAVYGRIIYTVMGNLQLNVVRTTASNGSVHLTVPSGTLTLRSAVRLDVGGDLSLAAGGPIVFEDGSWLQTAGGEIRLRSDAAITMAKGTLVDAGGGDVRLTAQYGVLLGRVVSPGATVTIDAGQGGIADGVDPADPPDADGADIEADRAVLHAAGSIGTRVIVPSGTIVDRLDTKVKRLDAVSENGLGIFLVNEGPLIIAAAANRTDAPPGIVDIVTTGFPAAASADRFDVNGDGATTPLDVLCLISDLNRNSTYQPARQAAEWDRLDLNRDGIISAQDLLQIIDYLNSQAPS